MLNSFFYMKKEGETKKKKAQRRAQIENERLVTGEARLLIQKRKKINLLPSFTRPAFGNVSELRTDFAIARFRVEMAKSSTTPLVFTTTLRESNRDVVFSPS